MCEQVTKLCDLGQAGEVQDTVCSVSWSQRGALLAVGTNAGKTQLWDIAKNKKYAPQPPPFTPPAMTELICACQELLEDLKDDACIVHLRRQAWLRPAIRCPSASASPEHD